MTKQEFERLYLCSLEPDPILLEIAAFLKYATEQEIKHHLRIGSFTRKELSQAIIMIEKEKDRIRSVDDNHCTGNQERD